jgi:hypothetical protein
MFVTTDILTPVINRVTKRRVFKHLLYSIRESSVTTIVPPILSRGSVSPILHAAMVFRRDLPNLRPFLTVEVEVEL